MKIHSPIGFKSNNYVLGYDDYASSECREIIREHYETYKMPYQSIYEKEGRLSEYAMNELWKKMLNRPAKIDNSTILSMNIPNVKPLKANVYRGATLVYQPECLKVLKSCGIKRVVDLVGYNRYKDMVENAGMEYFYLPMNNRDVWGYEALSDIKDFIKHHAPFTVPRTRSNGVRMTTNEWLEECKNIYNQKSRKFIDKFTEFIKFMDKGFLYIGCQCGTDQTDDAVLLYKLFSPQYSGKISIYEDFKIDSIRCLYNNLTLEDKKNMGWTENFDANFTKKLKKIETEYFNRCCKNTGKKLL